MPEMKQPPKIDNSKLVEAMKTFKAESNRENESNFLRNVINGKYLVPVMVEKPDGPIEAKPGETIKLRMAFQMLTNGKNEKFVPAFTSPEELGKRNAGKTVQVAVMTVRDLQNMFQQNVQCAGFVIDPFGENMTLTRDQLTRLLEIHQKNIEAYQAAQQKKNIIQNVQAQVVQELHNRDLEMATEEQKPLVNPAEALSEETAAEEKSANEAVVLNEEPTEMLDAISRYLKKQKVKQAFCKVCHGTDPHYLIAVDGKTELSELKEGIADSAKLYLSDGVRVDVIDTESVDGQKLAKTLKPFYKRSFFS